MIRILYTLTQSGIAGERRYRLLHKRCENLSDYYQWEKETAYHDGMGVTTHVWDFLKEENTLPLWKAYALYLLAERK